MARIKEWWNHTEEKVYTRDGETTIYRITNGDSVIGTISGIMLVVCAILIIL